MEELPNEESGMKCPACGSPRVYPSRLRSAVERLRHAVTGLHPHRCHACGDRRWRELIVQLDGPAAQPDDLRSGLSAAPVTETELDRLDPVKPRS
jgi:hypothetical protein